MTLTFDLLTLKVVSESRVTWATFVPILVFLGTSVLDLDPMHATDVRQTSDVTRASSLIAPTCRGGGIIRPTLKHSVFTAKAKKQVICAKKIGKRTIG